MPKKAGLFRSAIVCITLLTFLLNSTIYGFTDNINITPPLICGKLAPTEGSADFRNNIYSEGKILGIFFSIAEHYLDPQAREKSVQKALLGYLKTAPDFLREKDIVIDSVVEESGRVEIYFSLSGEKGVAVLCDGRLGEHYARTDSRWQSGDKFAVFVEKDTRPDAADLDNDLKGMYAPSTDPMIEALIQDGKVAEVYLDEDTGVLRATRIKWVKGYVPRITSQELYLGEEIDITQLFTEREAVAIREWMEEHKIRGAPVRFRAVLGDVAIGWNDDKEHTNISHAGTRDGVIYIGSILLKDIFKPENEGVRTELLDNDELLHIYGLGHDADDAYRARMDLVYRTAKRTGAIRSAMAKDDVFSLRDELQRMINAPDMGELLDTISIMNDVILGEPHYPVERSYSVKKAVNLLDKNDQEKLMGILIAPENSEYRDMIIADEILLMLVPADIDRDALMKQLNGLFKKFKDWIDRNWIRKFARELEGRTLWQISPEIWHEAGGLARVMQYHGAGMQELMRGSGARLKHIEPHYQYRISPDQDPRRLDYTNPEQLTHPILGKIEEVDRFKVTVGGKEVDVLVSKGMNDLGIEVYLVRDIQPNGESYYTHSLYNYKNAYSPDKTPYLPTWEEFSVFYSRAALEFVKREEAREMKDKANWKAPILHLNDSQTALVSVYRKIQLEEQLAKAEENPRFEVDRVLREMTVAFTTHTYGNRKSYSRNAQDRYGDKVLDFMGIPQGYRELFEMNFGMDYDMASAGLRSSDWQGAVARAHRDDVVVYDQWVNNPKKESLRRYYSDMGIEFDLRAVSNGDHRGNTMKYFIRYMKELFGDNADIEHPTAEQVYQTKKTAKERLSVSREKDVYTTEGLPGGGDTPLLQEGEAMLRNDQMVVSYSGRLVREKAGRGGNHTNGGNFTLGSGTDSRGAFDNANVKELVMKGVQVVIYGNVQSNNDDSDKLKEDLKKLVREISEMKKRMISEDPGKARTLGRFVFVPRFSLDEQRQLLAATDVQVQDSYPSTEAAGFTEADVSACGGIEVGTLRTDNKVGEGLFQAQGLLMDLNRPGVGNVLTPGASEWNTRTIWKDEKEYVIHDADSSTYLKALLTLHDKYNDDTLKEYQATSVRLSRGLEARLTAAAYLREFSKAISNKRKREARQEAKEKMKKMEQRNKSLFAEVSKPLPEMNDVERVVHEASGLVVNGDVPGAVKTIFSSQGFQVTENRLPIVAGILNNLLEAYSRDNNTVGNSRYFAQMIIEKTRKFSPNGEDSARTSREMQIMTGQFLTVLSWMRRGVLNSEKVRLTVKAGDMAVASDKKRGPSFLEDANLPGGDVRPYNRVEGAPLFYWRGVETISSKLKGNILEELKISGQVFEHGQDKDVMYLMDHGFVSVPQGILEATNAGEISTLHETFFVNDTLPGSVQSTSTGAGHFQGNKLDIKYVTEGHGVQVNVRYASDGRVEDVVLQEIKQGDWTLALPGYVDYVINLGGLRFNDISVVLSDEDAIKFNDKYDGTSLDAMEKVVKEHAKTAPFTGLIPDSVVASGPRLLRTYGGEMNVRWVERDPDIFGGYTLLSFYKGLISLDTLYSKIERLSSDHTEGETSVASMGLEISGDELTFLSGLISDAGDQAYTASPDKGMETFVEDNVGFLSHIFRPGENGYKLIRVPKQQLDTSMNKKEVIEFLNNIQALSGGRAFVELYNTDNITEVSREEYGDLEYKELPDELTNVNGNRTRANTVTIFPVFKGETLSTSGHRDRNWHIGNMSPEDTILSPIGANYDETGVIRSVMLGLRLSEIASNDNYKSEDSEFLSYTLAQYVDLCISQGQDVSKISLTKKDLIEMATSAEIRVIVMSLNRLIQSLPIVPFDVQELKAIYDRTNEILIRA
ncbi:MAG: glycogen/starch synthase [Candidatus Omnitrophica bacterium]|nr:glycogen/starch synthase [Candidatus Omnitrophota bacterium]MDD5487498.1 glycogen/starch synthase [Candidatus Omnitrophota bacterium]